MEDDDLPTAADIVTVHGVLEEKYDLKYKGARVTAPRLRLQDEVIDRVEEYDTPALRAAGLLRHTATAHVFEDANKRTGWTTAANYLEQHDKDMPPENDETARIVKRIRSYSVEEIAHWIETGEIDTDHLH